MDIASILVRVLLLLTAVGLIALILLQESKSSGLGLSGGGSNSVFGSRGATDTLFKMTAVVAIIFAGLVITSVWLSNKQYSADSVDNFLDGLVIPEQAIEDDSASIPSQALPVLESQSDVTTEVATPEASTDSVGENAEVSEVTETVSTENAAITTTDVAPEIIESVLAESVETTTDVATESSDNATETDAETTKE